jgi:hypothetical protein
LARSGFSHNSRPGVISRIDSTRACKRGYERQCEDSTDENFLEFVQLVHNIFDAVPARAIMLEPACVSNYVLRNSWYLTYVMNVEQVCGWQ